MFTTTEQVKELTGKEVSIELVGRAQAIIESYVGRIEGTIPSPDDRALLARATGYQAAYMIENEDMIYEQVAVSQIGQFGQIVNFRRNDRISPFVAPLAEIACRALSWNRTRSIKVGSIYGSRATEGDWLTS